MHIFFIKKLIKALLLRQLVSGKQVHLREICQPSFIKHLLCARKCDKNFVCSILLILHSNPWISGHCMSLSSHFGEVASEAQRGCVYLLSRVQLFVNCQAPLSMKFSRQEYWSGLSFPTPGDLPYPRIKPVSLKSPALAGRFFTTVLPGKSLLSLQVVSGREGCFVHLAQKLSSLPDSTQPSWGLRGLAMAWHSQRLILISPTLSLSL